MLYDIVLGNIRHQTLDIISNRKMVHSTNIYCIIVEAKVIALGYIGVVCGLRSLNLCLETDMARKQRLEGYLRTGREDRHIHKAEN